VIPVKMGKKYIGNIIDMIALLSKRFFNDIGLFMAIVPSHLFRIMVANTCFYENFALAKVHQQAT
jgi:hypothetical protein